MRSFDSLFRDDGFQEAMAFMVSQVSYIEPRVIEIKYPELNYAEFVPVDGEGGEWAKSITFFSLDRVGQANWFSHLAHDVPIADIARQKHEVGIEMAAVGYRYTLEELGQAMMVPGLNLGPERAASARRAYEEFCHNVTFYGDSRKAWFGITNLDAAGVGVDVVAAPHTWAYYMAQAPQQPQNLFADVNMLLGGIWQDSLGIEMADTLLLPMTVMTTLAMFQLPNTSLNLLEWIVRNNVYTQQTGRRLTIAAVRGLEHASTSGGNRAIAYLRDPEVLKLHRPMAHRFLDIWRTGPMIFDVPGIFRLGPVEARRPGAIRYLDDI